MQVGEDGFFVSGSRHGQPFLGVRACRPEVIGRPRDLPKQKERPGEVACICQLAIQRDRLPAQHRSTLKVALTKRQEPGGVECLGPDLLRNTLAACQRTLQEDPAFIHMSMSLPEVKQGTTQAQGHLVCMLLQHPLQSSAQVGILAFQPLQPHGLLCALKVLLGLLCQS